LELSDFSANLEERVCARKPTFGVLAFLANFKEKELIHFMSDLAI
jgi:hypothetical protein